MIKKLNTFDLKIIALVTMFIDHIGMMFYPEDYIFRIIGRISFCLFAFLLVEGFIYTSNKNKYLLKLLLWAFLSEIPFDLAVSGDLFNFNNQNIFFTLAAGIISLNIVVSNIYLLLKIGLIFCILFLTDMLNFDYSYFGVLLILIFYFFRGKLMQLALVLFIWGILASFKVFIYQPYAIIGMLPIFFYNGSRGKKTGDIFYTFYSVHLLILYLIQGIFIQ